MRGERYQLKVVQNGTGTFTPAIDGQLGAAHLSNKTVQMTGIAGGCSVSIEGTIDGTNWFASSAGAFTADGAKVIPESFYLIRTNRTVQGTGNPTVWMLAHNIQAG